MRKLYEWMKFFTFWGFVALLLAAAFLVALLWNFHIC